MIDEDHKEDEHVLSNQFVIGGADDQDNRAAKFPDCEMDDLQSTAEMIPIPVVLQVLDQEDA